MQLEKGPEHLTLTIECSVTFHNVRVRSDLRSTKSQDLNALDMLGSMSSSLYVLNNSFYTTVSGLLKLRQLMAFSYIYYLR